MPPIAEPSTSSSRNTMMEDTIRYPSLNLHDTFPNLEGESHDNPNFELYEYLGNDSWGLIFMHPGDFTPVCTTELGQAALHSHEFKRRGIKLVGFSCNDVESHLSWIKDIEVATGGKVDFPMFADKDREVSQNLGLLDMTNLNDKGLPMTVRSLYILKPDKTIALMMAYPAGSGRNFDEILRVSDSLLRTHNSQVATPVNWRPGQDVIVNFPLSNAQADAKFGPNGYKIIPLPSEQGKTLKKNYLRVTKDPGPFLDRKTKKPSNKKYRGEGAFLDAATSSDVVKSSGRGGKCVIS
ncbi:hypothetical protein ACA910_004651 [Epithemia clementina (nom. ined.)]